MIKSWWDAHALGFVVWSLVVAACWALWRILVSIGDVWKACVWGKAA